MLSRHARILGSSLSGLVLAGCAVDNPWFGLVSEDPAISDTGTTEDPLGTSDTNPTGQAGTTLITGTTSTTSITSSLATSDTGEPTTDSTTTNSVDTTTGHMVDSSGTSTGHDATTSTGENSEASDPSTTTEQEPPVAIVDADIATCILRKRDLPPAAAYGEPAECEAASATLSDAEDGVMIVDTEFMMGGGKGRRAEIYLRFPVAEFPDGKQPISATVTMHVDTDGDKAGLLGPLFQADPFEYGSLQDGAPATNVLLATANDLAVPGQSVTWSLDPGAVVSDAALHLALLPVDDFGILLRSAGARPGLAPTLTLTFE